MTSIIAVFVHHDGDFIASQPNGEGDPPVLLRSHRPNATSGPKVVIWQLRLKVAANGKVYAAYSARHLPVPADEDVRKAIFKAASRI